VFIDTPDGVPSVDDMLGFPQDFVIRELAGTSDRLRKGDFIGGYEVSRVAKIGNHQDIPAVTATLSLHGAEVGRLILVPTPGRDGYLPITRVFESQQAWDRFVNDLAFEVPEGCVRIPARAVLKGDTLVGQNGESMGEVLDEPEMVIGSEHAVAMRFRLQAGSTTDRNVFRPIAFGATEPVIVRRAD
jgi:hypothetical protein